MKKTLVLLTAVLVLGSCGSNLRRSNPMDPQYQNEGGTAGTNVIGRVKDGLTQLAMASVTVQLGSMTATTNSIGEFRFSSIPAGTYQLSVNVPYYSSFMEQLNVSGQEIWRDIGITSNVVINDNFDAYTPAVGIGAPWSQSTMSIFTADTVNAFSPSKCAAINMGDSAYYDMSRTLPGSFRGARVSGVLRVDQYTSEFKIGLRSAGADFVEFGYDDAASMVKFSTPSFMNQTSTVSGGLSPAVYYKFEITADNDLNSAQFKLLDNMGNQKFFQTRTIASSPNFSYTAVYIARSTSAAAPFTGYADDIMVVTK